MLSTPQPIPPPDKGTQPRPVTVSDFVSWEAVSWYIAMLMGVWGVFIGIGDYEIATSLFVFVSLIAWAKLGHATRITEPDRNTFFFHSGHSSNFFSVRRDFSLGARQTRSDQ